MRVNWRRTVGPRIRVPAGTLVLSMNPKDGGQIITKRAVVVVAEPLSVWGDRVAWAGSGGYWKDAHSADVKFIDPPDTRRVVEPGEDPS